MNKIRAHWRTVLIITVGLIAYHNSFSGVFLFDDSVNIVDNRIVRSPMATWPGLLTTGRNLSYATLALNYSLGGSEPWGYHLVNLAIHLLAAITLFDLVRRTLLLHAGGTHPPRRAADMACAVSLLWVAHPLNTQAVTYVVQRMESQMALFYLLSVYASLRGSEALSSQGRKWWSAITVLAAVASMASKEVGITIPVVVLLFDRAYLSGSLRGAVNRRWGMYLGLIASWIVLANRVWLAVAGGGAGVSDPRWSAGFFGAQLTPLAYAQTEPGVILHYLRLVIWPDPLCFDYMWPIAQAIEPGATVFLLALLGTATWAAWCRPAVGFLAITPFIVLALTSSMMPIADAAYEYRMYLPLTAITVLIVLGTVRVIDSVSGKGLLRIEQPVGAALTAIVAIILIVLTIHQNNYYRNEVDMWRRVIAICPENPRGHYNLGVKLAESGEIDEAIDCYRRAIEVDPTYLLTYNNLGVLLGNQGRGTEAIDCYRRVLELDPTIPCIYSNLGVELGKLGRHVEAIDYYRRAITLDPHDARCHHNMADSLRKEGRWTEAVESYRRAISHDPTLVPAHFHLGIELSQHDSPIEAASSLCRAIELDPSLARSLLPVFLFLGEELSRKGRPLESAECFRQATLIEPASALTHNRLGTELGKQGRLVDSEAALRLAIRLDPKFADARFNLAVTLFQTGRRGEAVTQFEEAVRLAPEVSQYRAGLGAALARTTKGGR